MSRCFRSLAIGLALMLNAGQGAAQDAVPDFAARALVAVEADDVDLLKEIVAGGADLASVESGGLNLVSIAAVRASPAMLAYLASQDVNIDLKDDEGYTPVMRALERARVDNALKLRELGASLEGVTNDGYTVRVLAEVAGLSDFGPEPPLPDILLSQEAANELLLKAVEFGDVQTVRLALDNRADVSVKASNGWTPIMIAALAGRADIMKMLIQAGALGRASEPFYTVDGKVDAVVAALVGKGNREEGSVETILCDLFAHKRISADNARYRAVATRLGFSDTFVDRLFPADDLRPLEIDLPYVQTDDAASWRSIQDFLQEKRFYDGNVDGIPGNRTLAALYAYFQPYEERLMQRGATAHARGRNSTESASSNAGYGQLASAAMNMPAIFGRLSGYSGGYDAAAEGTRERAVARYESPLAGSYDQYWLVQEADGNGLIGRQFGLQLAGGTLTIASKPGHVTVSFSNHRTGRYIELPLDGAPVSALPFEPVPGLSLHAEPATGCLRAASSPTTQILDYHNP